MKQIVVISGKGGTGKTVITASFAAIAEKSNISVILHNDWSDVCSKCREKLEIYHWVLNKTGDKFTPFTLDGSELPDDIRSAFK